MNTTDIQIRPVHPDEVEILRDFAAYTFRTAWQHMNEPGHFEDYCREHFTLEQMRAEMTDPAADWYFAVQGEQVVAYMKMLNSPTPASMGAVSSVQLERLYVHPDLQGKGLGARLIDFAENYGRERGAEWLWLSVWQKSPPSIAFYKRLGYEIFDVETFWVGSDPQDDWLMKKRIFA